MELRRSDYSSTLPIQSMLSIPVHSIRSRLRFPRCRDVWILQIYRLAQGPPV